MSEGIETELLFRATIQVGPARVMGPASHGELRVVPILSGSFEGPKLRGTILGGGADWQRVHADGVTEVEAHYGLETDDGVLIRIVNKGFRHGPPEVMARLAAGEPVDPALYYFRAAPVFGAPAGRYEWLNRKLFVSTGMRKPDAVILDVYEVL